MEQNHRIIDEVRISMLPVEENIRRLYEASKMGSIQILKTLVQEDPHLIQKILTSTSNTETPLHVSISHGHLDFTRLLLDHNPELAIEVDAFQQTPLHLASKHGDMETIQALLEKNTSACLVYDKNGLIPLHYAVISGQIEIMQELINARPQSLWMKLNNGQTILHLCVESNHLEGIKLLVETYMSHDEDFLNTVDDKGNTVLDLSLMLRQSEMVGYLISIPKVKTRTSMANFAVKSQETKARKPNRSQRRESESSSTKKTTRLWKELKKKMKYKGDWVQDVQNTMMLVATVIATVTYQAAINPPGGVWQEDVPHNKPGNDMNRDLMAGTAVMVSKQKLFYLIYSTANTVSFLASTSVILLVISRFPLKNRVGSWLLTLAMCAAVVFLALGYLLAFIMVSIDALSDDRVGFFVAIFVWIGLVGVICLYHVIRFLIWVVKSLKPTALPACITPPRAP